VPKQRTKREAQLASRAEELDQLREREHDSAFSGDQREVTGELSAVDQHPADVSDFTYQRELQATTQKILGREAQQVHEALRRQAEGKYGICEGCGRPIPRERLRARPSATLCVDCQREREEGRATRM
jgi:DnaK suppressor protein